MSNGDFEKEMRQKLTIISDRLADLNTEVKVLCNDHIALKDNYIKMLTGLTTLQEQARRYDLKIADIQSHIKSNTNMHFSDYILKHKRLFGLVVTILVAALVGLYRGGQFLFHLPPPN